MLAECATLLLHVQTHLCSWRHPWAWTSPTHTHSDAALHTRWHTAALFTCGLSSCPKPALKLPVFLRVSVKCVHMLLRGLRLEGDCFPSDKNHLAPSEEPAIAGTGQHRMEQHIAAALWHGVSVHRQERRTSIRGSEAISGLCYLTARLIAFILYFQKGKR